MRNMLAVLRAEAFSLSAVQYLIENQFSGKKPLPKVEQFVDSSLAEQLEKSGFVDALYK